MLLWESEGLRHRKHNRIRNAMLERISKHKDSHNLAEDWTSDQIWPIVVKESQPQMDFDLPDSKVSEESEEVVFGAVSKKGSKKKKKSKEKKEPQEEVSSPSSSTQKFPQESRQEKRADPALRVTTLPAPRWK